MLFYIKYQAAGGFLLYCFMLFGGYIIAQHYCAMLADGYEPQHD